MSLSRAEFTEQVLSTKKGERIVYHRGYLVKDRETDKALNMTANAALRATEEGHVHLFQRRLGPSDYEYMAEKQVPSKPIVWEGCYDPNRSNYVKPTRGGLDRDVVGEQESSGSRRAKAANSLPFGRRAVRHAA